MSVRSSAPRGDTSLSCPIELKFGMDTSWVVSTCLKYAWFDWTSALRIMMFQRILSVLKEFVL